MTLDTILLLIFLFPPYPRSTRCREKFWSLFSRRPWESPLSDAHSRTPHRLRGSCLFLSDPAWRILTNCWCTADGMAGKRRRTIPEEKAVCHLLRGMILVRWLKPIESAEPRFSLSRPHFGLQSIICGSFVCNLLTLSHSHTCFPSPGLMVQWSNHLLLLEPLSCGPASQPKDSNDQKLFLAHSDTTIIYITSLRTALGSAQQINVRWQMPCWVCWVSVLVFVFGPAFSQFSSSLWNG